jgi:O-antigen ligase
MTGSRYGLVSTGLGLAMSVFLAVYFRRRISFLVFTIMLFSILGIAAYNVAGRNQATSDRFQTLRNPLTTDSLRTRLDVLWRDAEREFFQSPFFGHGPAKTIFSDIVTDSEYLDVLKEFGIVGFFGYLAYYLFPLKIIWKGIKRARKINPGVENRLPATFLAMCFAFLLILMALVMNIGMSTFYNPALQGFLWFWMGIGVSAVRTTFLSSYRDTTRWTAVT